MDISTTGIPPNVGHFSPTGMVAHPKRTETTPARLRKTKKHCCSCAPNRSDT